MSNNQNLLGGGNKPAVGTITKQKKAGEISLNMTGQTKQMPQASSLEEKTKGFKFALPAKNKEVQSDGEMHVPTMPKEETQSAPQVEATTQAPALDKYQHVDQPENAEPDATQMFKENLALLEASFGTDKEAVASNVRNCMVYLQDHPELRDILQPEDVQMMVRGLRTSYSGIASSKRGKAKKSGKTAKEVDEVVDLLAGFELKI